jgi:hypothetical protein
MDKGYAYSHEYKICKAENNNIDLLGLIKSLKGDWNSLNFICWGGSKYFIKISITSANLRITQSSRSSLKERADSYTSI